MDIPDRPEDDVLAAPIRARLFAALADLRRPATTPELAACVGRHPNSVRVQLRRLADAGLVERRVERLARGRPRHAWAILPSARPGGAAPEAHAELGRWLARAMRAGPTLADVESAGREIGRDLAQEPPPGLVAQAMQDALTAMGFAPRVEPDGDDVVRYVLGNCPYRDAVAENQPVVCGLHRGITQGLLDRLAPGRRLKAFVREGPVHRRLPRRRAGALSACGNARSAASSAAQRGVPVARQVGREDAAAVDEARDVEGALGP